MLKFSISVLALAVVGTALGGCVTTAGPDRFAIEPTQTAASMATSTPVSLSTPAEASTSSAASATSLLATAKSLPMPALTFRPDRTLRLCPGITVHNAPTIAEDLRILDYQPFVEPTNGVFLALSPMMNACLTSGYGQRWGRLHKGIDLVSPPPATVYAAGEGRIVMVTNAGDYGNMVLIDHGRGIFTRYAHLERFDPHLAVGEWIGFGTPLGRMGRTAKRAMGLHLHYEILIAQDDPNEADAKPRLISLNPFALPKRRYAVFSGVTETGRGDKKRTTEPVASTAGGASAPAKRSPSQQESGSAIDDTAVAQDLDNAHAATKAPASVTK